MRHSRPANSDQLTADDQARMLDESLQPGLLLQHFLQVLRGHGDQDLLSMVLFGSWARGEARSDSDIDVLIIKERLPKSRLDRHLMMFAAAKEVSRGFASRVSVIPLTPDEAMETKPFYLGMLTACHVLYDRDDFFVRLLMRLRRRLEQLGAERRLDKDGYEYWMLKKEWKPGDVVEL